MKPLEAAQTLDEVIEWGENQPPHNPVLSSPSPLRVAVHAAAAIARREALDKLLPVGDGLADEYHKLMLVTGVAVDKSHALKLWRERSWAAQDEQKG